LCDSTITDQYAELRVKKIVLPSGENVGEPSFAGPETTPGAKICGVGADEVNPSISRGDRAMQPTALSDANARTTIWRCGSNNTIKLQERFLSLLTNNRRITSLIPFLTD
jgi:hypothetical protein